MQLLVFFHVVWSTELDTLSLHDALPIYFLGFRDPKDGAFFLFEIVSGELAGLKLSIERGDLLFGHFLASSPETISKRDRKSTRLNSSHRCISYAVFCLKKKKYTKIGRNV